MHKSVFLTNTDTTIGFISKEKNSLDSAKNRPKNKKYINALATLRALKKRVPKPYRKIVRRAKKTTFILNKDYSFRVIKDKHHKLLIDRLESAYTSSANESGKEYNFEYGYNHADVIVFPLGTNSEPSHIYKLGRYKIKKIR
ncbi:MAG TPA: Sua5 YciO YrdC YwlC family protein [Nitratifractor sp.]|jgi:tRNA A37 threonylcarbamoyladenosine synthetase subunit TsaC/SUA5/YrdC|nr:Sua5 YciO YrdC YwlC family protein [Nitratifractor sp.]